MWSFECPECGDSRGTMKSLYWHLKIDHKLPHEEAFSAAGSALQTDKIPSTVTSSSKKVYRGDLPSWMR